MVNTTVKTNKRGGNILKFSTTLMLAGRPTFPNGEIYTVDLITRLIERLSVTPHIIIQEINQVERKAKNISIAEAWDKKIMANVISGELVDGRLMINCETRLNRDGRKLAGIITENGIDTLEFFPVGYGVAGLNGVIESNYQLNYVAVEAKKK